MKSKLSFVYGFFFLIAYLLFYYTPVLAATPPFNVSGTFNYNDRPYGYSSSYVARHIRYATVKVWDEEVSADELLCTTQTDQNGYFSCTVPNNDDGQLESGRDIYVEVLAETSAGNVKTPSLSQWSTVTDVYQDWSGVDLNVGVQAPVNDEGNQVFNIYDQLIRGYQFVDYFTSQPVSITVKYEDGYTPPCGVSCYDKTYIHIEGYASDPDGFDDSIILHEYGHYISDKYSCDKSPGDSHSWCSGLSKTLAWSEGWATVFHALVRDRKSETSTYASQYYRDYDANGISIELDLEAKDCTGATREGPIAQAMWDLFDSNNDSNDSLTMGDDEIWYTVDNMDDTMVCVIDDFITTWHSRGYNQCTGFKEIFNDHGVMTVDSTCTPVTETCNNIDDDCDGQTDEGCDDDNDNFCDSAMTIVGTPSTCTSGGGDCNDSDPKEHPSQTWYKDIDDDGYSDGTTDTTSCLRPLGYKVASELTATSGDCIDGNASVNPGITEGPHGNATCSDTLDNDCDGAIDGFDIGCGISLPQTGQSKCYDTEGTAIACSGTGQDGEIHAGVTWPNPRFSGGIGAEADCVIDNLTGSMWPKDGNYAMTSGYDTDGKMTWNNAIAYANNLTLCGYTDWRLPNLNELESLVNADVPDIAAWLNNTQGFTNVQSNDYWSSTTYVFETNKAWSISLNNGGYLNNGIKNSASYYVLPVRSGQNGNPDPLYPANIWKTGQTKCYNASGTAITCTGTGQDGEIQAGVTWPNPRFTDNGNSAVTDNLTGLIWTKDAKTPGPSACTSGIYKTWQAALDHVKCLNTNSYLDYTDWRLPNRKELRNLIDYSKSGIALPTGHPFTNVELVFYWSSTTFAGSIDGVSGIGAWGISLFGGNIMDVAYKNESHDSSIPPHYYYVWPVRSGQSGTPYFCDDDSDGYISSSISGTCTELNCVPIGCQTTTGDDCNDSDPAVNPGATEICDNVDNDCDLSTPDGSAESWYGTSCDGPDTDLCNEGTYQCTSGSKTCSDNTGNNVEICNGQDDDCNPATSDGSGDPDIGTSCDGPDTDLCKEGTYQCSSGTKSCSDNTGNNVEICNGEDDDCNPATSDGSAESWYGTSCDGPDTDLCAEGVFQCTGGIKTCSDTTGNNVEICNGRDDDCNPATSDDSGDPDIGTSCDGPDTDLCKEGTYQCSNGTKSCSDNTGNNLETCNGEDDDCDNQTDEGLTTDADGDGHSTPASCLGTKDDCNDSDNTIYPGAPELCDRKDNDCDGDIIIDENLTRTTTCGVGECVNRGTETCINGEWGNSTCIPKQPSAETCDNKDNNCNNQTDEGCDDDNDNYCDSTMTIVGTPSTCTAGGGDCIDSDNQIYPGAFEKCDGKINNCNNLSALDGSGESWYGSACDGADSDLCTEGTWQCSSGAKTCSDNTGNNVEICNGQDDDCDNQTDEGCDDDNDNYCDSTMTIVGTPPTCTAGGGDCNDSKASIKPGATEVCDNVENNCNNQTDEGCDDDNDNYCDSSMTVKGTPSTCTAGGGDCNDDDLKEHPKQKWYKDNDNDGYSDGTTNKTSCPRPLGYKVESELIQISGDYHDDDIEIYPGAFEKCDGKINNCNNLSALDGSEESWYALSCDGADSDLCAEGTWQCSSGSKTCSDNTGDNVEICDGQDNNCDNHIDEGCDDDNDNYCDSSMTVKGTPSTCTAGGGDCDDSNAAIKPGVPEVCDNVDNNCNNQTDEGCDDDNDNYCDSTMTIVGTPSTCPAGGGDCDDDDPKEHPNQTWYKDIDDDGYSDGTKNTTSCERPLGYKIESELIQTSGDCDDDDLKEHPNQTWYKDIDNDGYSDGTTDTTSCPRPSGYKVASELMATSGDCNDGNANINPERTEGPYGNATCSDQIDNDCDGAIDNSDIGCGLTPPGIINLSKTGQTKCYDTAGYEVTCMDTGHDGEIQAGVVWQAPRFTMNTDATVTDSQTGLIWAKDGNIMLTRDPGWDNDGAVTWQYALDYVAKLNAENYLGHNDWRLPNINELESLINADMSDLAVWLNSQGFTNMQSYNYWSSTTLASNTGDAWSISLNNGGWLNIGIKNSDSYYVLLVRSGRGGGAFDYSEIWKTGQTASYYTGDDGELEKGAAWPNPRFTDNGNGTVTDNLTGLVWLKDANCMVTQYPSFDNDGTAGDGQVTWQHALDFLQGINKGINNRTYSNCGAGYRDWRLPNRKELHSLIDYGNLALPTGDPFANVQSDYLSSTSYTEIGYTNDVWLVSMLGYVESWDKESSLYVWPVRSRQSWKCASQVKIKLDLVVSSLTAPKSATRGSTITITDTTKNKGKGCDITGESRTCFYLSVDKLLDAGDIKLACRTVPPLSSRQSSTGSTDAVIPSGIAARSYYIISNADDLNAVNEANEKNNNKKYKKIKISP